MFYLGNQVIRRVHHLSCKQEMENKRNLLNLGDQETVQKEIAVPTKHMALLLIGQGRVVYHRLSAKHN